MTEPLDTAFMERIAQGDQKAFTQFYDRHSTYAYGLILRILCVRSDADEVLQETFWQVWKDAKNYDPCKSSPRAWVFLLARSRAFDHLRRKHPTPAIPTEQPDETQQDPSDYVRCKESNARIRLALNKLPQEQATCIELAFFQGLTHNQISQKLSVPLGTVKTRIRLGMYKLKSILQEPTV